MKKLKKMKKKKKNERKEEKKKTKSELAREKRNEASPSKREEVLYPLVPTKKDKEWHVACFLDIFKKLEIIMPFGEALQQMPLYSKFLKDMLKQKNKYIHSENIIVEGNYNAVI